MLNLAKCSLFQLKNLFLWAAWCQSAAEEPRKTTALLCTTTVGDWTHSSGSLDKPVGFYCHYCNLQTFLNCLQSNCGSYLYWHGYNVGFVKSKYQDCWRSSSIGLSLWGGDRSLSCIFKKTCIRKLHIANRHTSYMLWIEESIDLYDTHTWSSARWHDE